MSEPEPLEAAATPPHFDVYFSYNSRDRALVEPIAARLKRAGLEPWLDRWALTPGGDWQRELGAGLDACVACAVFVGAHDIGAWELQEVTVAIDRAATQRGFRVFPVLLPGVDEPFDPNRLPHFLRARTWVDFRDPRHDRRALQHLINAVKGVPFGPEVAVVRGDEVAPYRGLRVFGEEDARFFFGRDREIQRLLEKLKSSPFLAVLGPSGSGKSSLVRAGLVPELRAGALAVDGDWHVCVLRPGAAPLTALAAQLVELRPGDGMQATLDALGRDPRTLHLSVELALADGAPGERVLVIVDQLEEVFTLCNDESQRRQLFANLMYATSQAGGRTVVVVTMRADFYARCAAYPEFAQLMTAQQMLIGPIDGDGLRQVIEEPARRVGLELEAGLSDTILADVAAEPGALPLLEHALLELWERRRGELLTLEGYRDAGGVHGALAQRADKTFDGFSPDQREVARRALLRLTQPGEGTEDTRRRATRRELATAEGDDSFEMVLGRLVDARMLTTGRDETGQEVVDVSHEALIRGWPRLRRWIDADRAGLVVHRRLTDAAREWDGLGREPAALYRGARLAAAHEWAADHADDLSPLEGEFVVASRAAEQREIEDAVRSSRRRRALATGIATMTVIVAAVLAFALAQRHDARRHATEANALTMAQYSTTLLGLRPDLSMLLGLAADRADDGADERSSVIAALTTVRERGVLAILHGQQGPIFGVAISPDGRILASAGGDDSVRLWNLVTRKPVGQPLQAGAPVLAVAFSPDGQAVASGGSDGAVRLWNVTTGRELGGPLRASVEGVTSVAFGPAGMLAAGSPDGTVRLWSTATRIQQGGPLQADSMAVYCVAFGPHGTLATAGADGSVRLWSVATHKALGSPLRGGPGVAYSVAFGANGTLAVGIGSATSTGAGTVDLWDVPSGRLIAELPNGSGATLGVAFSRDGRLLASASQDQTVRVWDVATRALVGQPLAGQTGVVDGVAFGDGSTLASASEDGTIWLWDVKAHPALGASLPAAGGAVSSLVFSPTGTSLAWGSADGAVRLWNLTTHTLLVPPLPGTGGAVGSVAISADGGTLASTDDNSSSNSSATIRLWNARTGGSVGRLAGQPGGIDSLAFSHSGLLASGGQNGTVWLWEVAADRRIGQLATSSGNSVDDVAFSPDGLTLAAANTDSTISLWDVRTHRLIGKLSGHTNEVYGVAFSPDGRTLASASADYTIRLWDVATGRQVREFTGPKAQAFTVEFSPDGHTLVVAYSDGTVRLWDVATGQPLGVPLTGNAQYGPGSLPGSAAFSPDGRSLATIGADGAVRLWPDLLWPNSTDLLTQVCGLVGGGLSPAEWSQYAAGVPYRTTCP